MDISSGVTPSWSAWWASAFASIRHRTILTWQFKAAVLKNSLGAKSSTWQFFCGSSLFTTDQVFPNSTNHYCNYKYSAKGKFPGNQALLHKALRPWWSVCCTCALAASSARAASTRPCAAATLRGAIPDRSASSGSAFSRSNLSRSSESVITLSLVYSILYMSYIIVYIYIYIKLVYDIHL